jgi:hypothetical protein
MLLLVMRMRQKLVLEIMILAPPAIRLNIVYRPFRPKVPLRLRQGREELHVHHRIDRHFG